MAQQLAKEEDEEYRAKTIFEKKTYYFNLFKEHQQFYFLFFYNIVSIIAFYPLTVLQIKHNWRQQPLTADQNYYFRLTTLFLFNIFYMLGHFFANKLVIKKLSHISIHITIRSIFFFLVLCVCDYDGFGTNSIASGFKINIVVFLAVFSLWSHSCGVTTKNLLHIGQIFDSERAKKFFLLVLNIFYSVGFLSGFFVASFLVYYLKKIK